MCEVRRAYDGWNTLPIIYQSVLICWMSEPRDQESGGAICKNNNCLSESGITMLGMK